MNQTELEQAVLSRIPGRFEFVSLNGHRLILRSATKHREPLSTPERGHRLLMLEKDLKDNVDSRLEVFLQPMGDLNVLRTRLRGVKV